MTIKDMRRTALIEYNIAKNNSVIAKNKYNIMIIMDKILDYQYKITININDRYYSMVKVKLEQMFMELKVVSTIYIANRTDLFGIRAEYDMKLNQLLNNRNNLLKRFKDVNNKLSNYDSSVFLDKLNAMRKCTTKLAEWRPWNHINYPTSYRNAMKTLVVLAKALPMIN